MIAMRELMLLLVGLPVAMIAERVLTLTQMHHLVPLVLLVNTLQTQQLQVLMLVPIVQRTPIHQQLRLLVLIVLMEPRVQLGLVAAL